MQEYAEKFTNIFVGVLVKTIKIFAFATRFKFLFQIHPLEAILFKNIYTYL